MITKDRLDKVFRNVMDTQGVNDSMSVINVEEWDSQTHITLILELEKEYGISISAEEAGEMLSVLDIKKVLAQKGVAS
jgi:acyl carrier protein